MWMSSSTIEEEVFRDYHPEHAYNSSEVPFLIHSGKAYMMKGPRIAQGYECVGGKSVGSIVKLKNRKALLKNRWKY